MANLVITNASEIDDAGGTHYDFRMPAGKLVDLVADGRIKLQGNIRPDWQTGKMKPKTRKKVYTWAEEFLAKKMVVGNLSLRLDPNADFDIETSTDNPDFDDITLKDGAFLDTSIDSESRIRSVLLAHEKAPALFPSEQRLSFRLYVAEDSKAAQVARDYNTKGDRVNDSAAKSAHPQTPSEKLSSWLLDHSGAAELGPANIELLANSVSKNSSKLVAFNTMVKALEQTWADEPTNDLAVAKQGKFIADLWAHLASVRPEFGLVGLIDRQKYRTDSMAGTALSFYGVFAVMDELWRSGANLAAAKASIDKLAPRPGDPSGDWLSRSNPLWLTDGIVHAKTLSSGATAYPTRNNFQTRSAVSDLFLDRIK